MLGQGIREGRLVTNGAGAVASTVFNQEAVGNTTTFQCLGVSQIVFLDIGESIWLEAFHDSGGFETISVRSRFSCERVGQPIG